MPELSNAPLYIRKEMTSIEKKTIQY